MWRRMIVLFLKGVIGFMKKFLIISQILYLLCTFPWLLIFGLSFMSFDNGFALANVSFVLSIGLYPIAVIICSIMAWILHVRKRRVAIIVNLLPMLWIVFLGLPLIIINFF
jgi:hypothetical protein